MSIVRTLPPNAEPLSVVQVREHLRVYSPQEDALLRRLIGAARGRCENEIQRSIIATRWKLIANAFPGNTLMGVPFGEPHTLPAHALQLPVGEVLQVVSVTYLGMDGVRTTMPSTDYAVDLAVEPARITPRFGKIWPITLPQIGAVEVTFDSGHAAPVTAVDTTADTITAPRWKTLAAGDALRLFARDRDETGEATLPAPLAEAVDYFVETVVSPGVYTLMDGAGAHIDLTSGGTGEIFVGEIPEALCAWMLLAIGTLYENRQSITVDAGIGLASLPDDFMDGLLDPFRLVTYP